MAKGGCAVNCRYCFRRHFPYDQNPGNKASWQQAIDYIAVHPEIEEVIFSGGDPMMAKDSEWAWLLERLEKNTALTAFTYSLSFACRDSRSHYG